MDRLDLDSLNIGLRVISVCANGLYAGGSLYTNIVETPANLKNEVGVAHKNWKVSSKIADEALPQVHSISLLAAIASYLLTRKTHKCDTWFLWTALVGELAFPYSMMFLVPIEKELRKSNVQQEKGEEHVSRRMRTWNKFHSVQTLLAVSTFGYMLYRIAKGPN